MTVLLRSALLIRPAITTIERANRIVWIDREQQHPPGQRELHLGDAASASSPSASGLDRVGGHAADPECRYSNTNRTK